MYIQPKIKKVSSFSKDLNMCSLEKAHSEITHYKSGESYIIYIDREPLILTKVNDEEALYTYNNYTFTFFIETIPVNVKDFLKHTIGIV
jgi:hypothetical protein